MENPQKCCAAKKSDTSFDISIKHQPALLGHAWAVQVDQLGPSADMRKAKNEQHFSNVFENGILYVYFVVRGISLFNVGVSQQLKRLTRRAERDSSVQER